jgi:hypothetical protein
MIPSRPIGPHWLPEVGRDLTALGGVAALTLTTVFVAGYLLIVRKYHAMWLVLAATLGGLLISTLLKHLIDRARPDLVHHLSHVYTSSFPSGHSMLSAVVYLTLGALLTRLSSERRVKLYIPRRRAAPDLPRRRQPRLHGRPLSHRRPGRLDRRPRLGASLLGRRPLSPKPRRGREGCRRMSWGAFPRFLVRLLVRPDVCQ